MIQNTSVFAQRLDALREQMAAEGLDGYIVPLTDEYQGEYGPACAQRLAWLTGFTGSAGVAAILKDKAAVMSDGRYTIQLSRQIDKSVYAPEDSIKTPVEDWLAKQGERGAVIGFDPRLFTPAQVQKIQEKQSGKIFTIRSVSYNLIDRIWTDRPKAPQAPVKVFSEDVAGLSLEEKIAFIVNGIKEKGAYATVLTLSDSIAWLLNIRGADVPHMPVALSYAIVRKDGVTDWFIEENKLDETVKTHLGDRVRVKTPADLESALAALAHDAGPQPVMLDPRRTALWFFETLKAAGAQIVESKDPCIDIRACKTSAEQDAMKRAHIRDGVALTRFLKWMDEEGGKGGETELSVEAKLEGFRKTAPEWQEPSFDTIAGFGPNGAIVHYRATGETCLPVRGDGLLLVDSGAQYDDGTTDVTRTIAIGTPSQEMRENFTLVLKGHIAVATARFRPGTTGAQIDALARAPLREKGLDYAHGTGHGVGCNLSVHEEAASLSPKGEEAPKAGMILSNEPGFYKEGEYGIRIENLVLVTEEGGDLGFDTITLAPLDKTLIVMPMLSDAERDWINGYHTQVYDTLAPLLDDGERAWLKQATAAL